MNNILETVLTKSYDGVLWLRDLITFNKFADISEQRQVFNCINIHHNKLFSEYMSNGCESEIHVYRIIFNTEIINLNKIRNIIFNIIKQYDNNTIIDMNISKKMINILLENAMIIETAEQILNYDYELTTNLHIIIDHHKYYVKDLYLQIINDNKHIISNLKNKYKGEYFDNDTNGKTSVAKNAYSLLNLNDDSKMNIIMMNNITKNPRYKYITLWQFGSGWKVNPDDKIQELHVIKIPELIELQDIKYDDIYLNATDL